MEKFTIMTVWNDENMFRQLQENLAGQTGVEYTLLGVDNRGNPYPGIRQALLDHLDQVDTPLVLFAHQDIRFLEADALSQFVAQVEKLENLGVAGVAGCPAGSQWQLLSNIVHGKNMTPAGKTVSAPQAVQSVDECLFAMEFSTLKKLPFTATPGWHLYAVEQCIQAQQAGLTNYVVPASLYHLSDGKSLDPSYLTMLKAMCKTYDISHLNTTVKQWRPGTFSGRCYISYYYMKQKLKRFLLKRGLLKG